MKYDIIIDNKLTDYLQYDFGVNKMVKNEENNV